MFYLVIGSDDQWEVFSRYVDLFDESANKMHHIDKDTTLNSVYDINDLSVTHKELICEHKKILLFRKPY